ncbi:MAG TPA: VOC family protein [Fimbriimonadaceae bacterium]|nr:VOC family protein [Fimbriimonadaceae bacterium]
MNPEARSVPQEPNPKPLDPRVEIGHVHLRASDLTRIEEFYVGVLGFHVVARMPGALFLAAGDYHHHLAFNTWHSRGGSAPSLGTTGLYHVALRYPTPKSLADALRRLIDAQWPLDGASDHGTHIALYLTDPEGNGLELEWDRPKEEWPVNAQGHLMFTTAPLDLQALLANE